MRLILVPGEMRLVAQSAIEFAGGQVADAEFGEVGGIALVELLKREIVFLDLIVAKLHGFTVVDSGSDERAAIGDNANAEFQSGGFVIGDEKTVRDAGTIDEMHVQGAIAGRRVDTAGDTRPEGQLMRDCFGVFLEAIEEAGVLIKKDEEENGTKRECGKVPWVRAKRAEYSESEDGADERETSNDAADPATFGDGAQVFRKVAS